MDEKINLPNEGIRYYTGLLRDLETIIKSLKKRVAVLENRTSNLPNVSDGNSLLPQSTPNLTTGNTSTISSSSGGFSKSEIKAFVVDWIKNGELPIPIHDHTDGSKGGDAFAEKGAKLQ